MKLLLLTLPLVLCLVACATPQPGSPGPDAGRGPDTGGDEVGSGAINAEPQPSANADRAASDPAGDVEAQDELPEVGAGPDLIGRAQSAMEGAVLGAVLGAQAGPIGAAVGAGTLLVYGAITGHVPLSGPSGRSRDARDEENRERDMEEELRKEEQRGEHLEDEIEAELQRQEELLREIEAAEKAGQSEREGGESQVATRQETQRPAPDAESLSERADPRAAPRAPQDRELPLAIFDKERITIPRDAWGNHRELSVVKRSLDADMDGRPEQIRYFDAEHDRLLRMEQDTDYDGDLDTWQTYEDGQLATRLIDASDNGHPDVWESYRNLVMVSRDVDRDGDGVRDAFYEYEDGSLVRERHDANGDGIMDLVVHYDRRLRVRAEEDRDRDGRMDSWTTYTAFEDEELVSRVERDTNGSGKIDLIETYAQIEGRAALARREEDKNGDGEMDIKSIYENGKLVRREISDPDLVPL